jgi:hypothetical protein
MRAITLWQPYASLIAAGVKHYETRGWKPPQAMIGKRIAIHAALRDADDLLKGAKRLPSEVVEVIGNALLSAGFGEVEALENWNRLPRGAVVATAIIDIVHRAEDIRSTLSAEELAVGDWDDGRFGWLLRDVQQLTTPIPAKGFQRIWNWTPPEGFEVPT